MGEEAFGPFVCAIVHCSRCAGRCHIILCVDLLWGAFAAGKVSWNFAG